MIIISRTLTLHYDETTSNEDFVSFIENYRSEYNSDIELSDALATVLDEMYQENKDRTKDLVISFLNSSCSTVVYKTLVWMNWMTDVRSSEIITKTEALSKTHPNAVVKREAKKLLEEQ